MKEQNLDALYKEIDFIFLEYLNGFNDEIKFIFKKCNDFIKRPSKKIRPLLFFSTLEELGIKIEKEHVKISVVFELLHSFALIHDDIVDNSETRRGGKSFHIDLKERYELKNENIAIISGDTIFSMCFSILSKLKLKNDTKIRLIEVFSEICFKTSIGELKDLTLNAGKEVSKDDIFKYYDLKTGIYTFVLPVKCAFIVANKENRSNMELENALLLAGRYFQIKNDIKDISNKKYLDFFNNKNTFLNTIIFSHCEIKYKNKLKKMIREKNIDELLNLYKKFDVINKAELFCKELKKDFLNSIKSQDLLSSNFVKFFQRL